MGYLYEKEREAIERRAAEAAEAASVAERIRFEKRLATKQAEYDRRLAMAQDAKKAVKVAAKATIDALKTELSSAQRQLVARNGCPPELHEGLIEELCEKLRRYPMRTACELNGISPQKLQSWRAKSGAPGAHPLLVELNRQVALAIAEGNAAIYDQVEKAAQVVMGTETRIDGAGRERERDILLQRADAKVLLELARARMPELSPRAIMPVEEDKLEDAVDFRTLMTDQEFEAHLAGEAARAKALERATSNEMLVRMNERARLPAIDTLGENVGDSADDES